MFKSLLRTLPSLTGNVTLACKITDVDIQENNISIGYCREAELKPLQNNLFNRYVSVNLSTGSYKSLSMKTAVLCLAPPEEHNNLIYSFPLIINWF